MTVARIEDVAALALAFGGDIKALEGDVSEAASAAQAAQQTVAEVAPNVRKLNTTAARAPLPTDDASQGYAAGSRWLWGGQEWVAAEVAAGAARWVKVTTVTPQMFGARADGVTNDKPAIQAALDFLALAGGGRLHFPEGRYHAPNTGSSLTHKSHVSFTGEGMGRSVIVVNDSASSTRKDLFYTAAAYRTQPFDLSFDSLGIEGDWGAGGDWTSRSHLLEIWTTGHVRVTNCRFSSSRYMSTVFHNARSVYASGCEYIRGVADGFRATECADVRVIGCYFEAINDDAIAIHTNDADPEAARRTSLEVVGNRIVDSQGICCLGARRAVVSGNVLSRVLGRAIEIGVGSGSGEGGAPGLSINITNNIIDTVFNAYRLNGSTGGDICRYIRVGSAVPTPDANGRFAGEGGAGGVRQPFADFLKNEAGNRLGSWFVNVSGNVCTRSLAPTAAYSDYGFGQRLTRVGPADPQITDQTFGAGRDTPMISVTNHLWNANISNNVCWGGEHGIGLVQTGTDYTAWRNVTLTDNNIGNFRVCGYKIVGRGDVTISGGIIDGDPLFSHPQRAPGGAWTMASPGHTAFHIADGFASVSRVKVRNTASLLTGSDTDQHLWSDTILCAAPVVHDGYHPANKGIGDLPRMSAVKGRLVVEECDPSSPKLGEVLAIPLPKDRIFPKTPGIIRFGYLTDTHNSQTAADTTLNRYFPQAPQKTQAAVTTFKGGPLDFIIHGGDLIEGYGARVQDIADAREIVTILKGARLPTFYVSGNHDLVRMSFAEFAGAVKEDPRGYYAWDIEDVRFIVLDTCYSADDDASHYSAGGFSHAQKYIPPAQRAWLQEQLASWGGRFLILTHHHISSQAAGTIYCLNSDAVQAIMEPYAARILGVISGHRHTNERTVKNGIAYYGMAASVDGPLPAAAHSVIAISPTGLTITGYAGQSSW